jgi:hypothetical protein
MVCNSGKSAEISAFFIGLYIGGVKRFVLVKIVPTPFATSLVEVSNAVLRIGKELNVFQELLKQWYFTCYSIGTASFMTIYFLLCSFLLKVFRQRREEVEEPSCELEFSDSDFNFETAHVHPERHTRQSADTTGSVMRDAPADRRFDQDGDEWEDLYYEPSDDTVYGVHR